MSTSHFLSKNMIIKLLIVCTLVFSVKADEIYSKNSTANKLLKKGDTQKALELYNDAQLLAPEDKAIQFNKGAAHFKLNEFDKAESSFSSALTHEKKEIRADAHYNLGNTLFKQGDQLLQSGDPKAQEKYKGALQNYIKALETRPNDKDAKWNLQLAHLRMKEAEKQQQQQQKDDKKDDKNKQDKQENDKSSEEQNKDEQKQDQSEKKEQEQEQQNNKPDKNKPNEEETPSQSEKKPDDKKKEEALRTIMLYADDADSLNKPQKNKVRQAQPEKDW